LAVKDVKRSVGFYGKKRGLKIGIDSAPDFALVRVGPGASIGLLAARHAVPKGTKPASKAQHPAIQGELSTDDLDGLYRRLKSRRVSFTEPPRDEAWERSAQARDPDGSIRWNSRKGGAAATRRAARSQSTTAIALISMRQRGSVASLTT
jgi:hypothetical protein